ncbi:hypothetical protein KZ483_26990 [Paenibacillus sp. sptzw28]|uniref:hypothetical protein n=1 Tax=Paenibacillus sp. sptzw28 TaxID=715179 RepID=UPI001C6E22F7|nr:hypothetical protein [Paenibacillus sp. sptzw28]QYR21284.1 hypothetical protein KZ483_26990 [Paenibacillus sp. sptzw28]
MSYINKVILERYSFSGFHKSHVGAIKSCLDYLNIPCSPAWVYGMTGSAFISVIDRDVSAPNIGEPEEAMFDLARHLGLDIEGYHTFADKAGFERLQSEVWDAARFALDQGLPVFAKELDLGNETSVVYAYDEEGYYTHSWHAGSGHEGFDDVIPWTELGRNYCPCAMCKARKRSREWANETVYTGEPQEGGFISLHWASLTAPSDDRTALRAALRFALDFSRRETYEWGGRTFYSGPAAYDRWIETLRTDTILGFYMGYFADIGHESRRYAQLFLKEASERFDGAFSEELRLAADHYTFVHEAFRSLVDLFPWSQPHTRIEDPDRRREAVEILTRIKQLEMEGYRKLENLLVM